MMVAVVIALFVVLLPGTAGAQPAPITTYDDYPPELPETCTVDGPDVLQGLLFTVNGESAEDLRTLNVDQGDTVTMTWDSFTPGCEGLGIGLSTKIAGSTEFDPSINQYGLEFSYCGPEGPECGDGPFQLTLRVPPPEELPCYQIDAHIGPPLAVVGPDGAFYGLGNEPNMLISAKNGGGAPCDVPVCETNPDLPAQSPLCNEDSAATEDEVCIHNPELPADSPDCVEPVPTTTPPTTEAPPSPQPTEVPQPEPEVGGQSVENPAANGGSSTGIETGVQSGSVSSGAAQAGSQNLGTLPRTGSDNGTMAVVAGLFLAAGGYVAWLFKRPRGRHFAGNGS